MIKEALFVEAELNDLHLKVKDFLKKEKLKEVPSISLASNGNAWVAIILYKKGGRR